MTARYTMHEIATALGVHRTSVLRRARREGWAYTERSGIGGRRRLYAESVLPDDLVLRLAARDAIRTLDAAGADTPMFILSVDGVCYSVRRLPK